MRHMRYYKICIVSFILFFSCSVNSGQTIERKEKGLVIDLDNTKINTEDYFLYSSIYKNTKTIVLETNESSIIGIMKKMRVYDPYIIVLDSYSAKSVFIFDMNGHFIRKIGQVGSGPGEYIQPSDFAVDKEGKVIYVLDSRLNKINKYDLTNGKFIHSIQFEKDVRSYNIEFVGGKLFADAYFYKHSDSNYLIRIVQEPSGKIDGHFLNVKEYGKGISNISNVHNNVFYLRENGNAAFVQPLMDQIIEISNESVFSVFEIKSKDVLTSEIISKEIEKDPNFKMLNFINYNKYFHLCDFVEYGNHIQFNYQIGTQLKMILYNKQSHEVRVIQKTWNDLFYINKVNDKAPMPKVGCYDAQGIYYFYNTNQVERLQQLAYNGALSPALDRLEELKNLEADANPVIFYYEFKD